MRSAEVLEDALNTMSCFKKSSDTLLNWWARYDKVHTELKLIGLEKSDREKKAKAMCLCGEQYAPLAEYLGGPEDVIM